MDSGPIWWPMPMPLVRFGPTQYFQQFQNYSMIATYTIFHHYKVLPSAKVCAKISIKDLPIQISLC